MPAACNAATIYTVTPSATMPNVQEQAFQNNVNKCARSLLNPVASASGVSAITPDHSVTDKRATLIDEVVVTNNGKGITRQAPDGTMYDNVMPDGSP
jgi:hypothetical protein